MKKNKPKQRSVKFTYKGKKYSFVIRPESGEEVTARKKYGNTFDITYSEDYNDICVYLVVNGFAQYEKTTHKQKINPNE